MDGAKQVDQRVNADQTHLAEEVLKARAPGIVTGRNQVFQIITGIGIALGTGVLLSCLAFVSPFVVIPFTAFLVSGIVVLAISAFALSKLLNLENPTTPLYHAAKHNHACMARTLLFFGANANSLSIEGVLALHAAAETAVKDKDPTIFKTLIAWGADWNPVFNASLIKAVEHPENETNAKVVKFLIQEGYDPKVALVSSVTHINEKAVKILLDAGANADYVDEEGNNLMHLLALSENFGKKCEGREEGRDQRMIKLLKSRVKNFDVPNKDRKTPAEICGAVKRTSEVMISVSPVKAGSRAALAHLMRGSSSE